jgi:hypothetical protein
MDGGGAIVTAPRRIGPVMARAVDYVRQNPGCRILPVAERVGPNGSRKFGYRAVHRAIRAGLIVATKDAHGRYSLEVRS